MNIFTVSNSGFSRLAANLAASARRAGIDVTVYVPSDGQRIPGLNCAVLECVKFKSAEVNAYAGAGFSRAMEFKLLAIKHNLDTKNVPFLYLDSDTSILHDPAGFIGSIDAPLAMQERDCAPLGGSYCMGMMFVGEHQEWISSLLAAPLEGLMDGGRYPDDETLVNHRINLLPKPARARIAKLPHPKFMLGCFRPEPETLVYHANFTQLHGETTGIENAKIKRLRDMGAWFAPDAPIRSAPSEIGQEKFFFGRPIVKFEKSHFVQAIELSVLERLINDYGVRSVLEIGINRGETARKILDSCPGVERYTGIEITKEATPSMDRHQWAERDFDDGIVAKAVSGDPRVRVFMSPRGSMDFPVVEDYDLVFIDGNHAAEWVRHDIRLAWALNARVIVWHDHEAEPGVSAAIADLGCGAVHVRGTKVAYEIMRGVNP